MRTRARPSWRLWFALSVTGTFVYGLESWRRHAARAAERSEHARFAALARCALGADAPRLLGSVSATRRRLRALALGTSLEPSTTWLDRCVPLARGLAVHAPELENTRAPNAAGTLLESRARALTAALGRVGAVWQARAGDPSEDFAALAEHLVATHAELQLATDGAPAGSASRGSSGPVAQGISGPVAQGISGPVAPGPWRPAPTLLLPLPGAVFLPSGTPARFLVGTPPPTFSRVRLLPGALSQEVVPNEGALQWHTVGDHLVRVEQPATGRAQRTLVVVEGPASTTLRGNITLPPGLGVDLRLLAVEAQLVGAVPWVLSAVEDEAPVLWRAAPRQAPQAAPLGPALPPRGPSQSAPRPSIALTTDGTSLVAAWLDRPLNGQRSVRVARVTANARGVVNRVVMPEDWAVAGRRPGLGLCASRSGLWLFAAGRDRWLAGVVEGGRVREVLRAPRSRGAYGEELTVRCGDEVLAYGQERPRGSPLWRCGADAEGPRCEALPAVLAPEPAGLGGHETRSASGQRVSHPEWPLVFVLTPDGAALRARAAGPVVSVARLDRGAAGWGPEVVLWDAQGEDPGGTVTDLGLFGDSARVVLAVSARDELRVTSSLDGGRTWERP